MSDERRLAVVNDYDGLVAALRARADELNIAYSTIDDIAGLQSNYAAKLLAPVPIKTLGKISLGPMLQAMGCALVLVEDREMLDRIRSRLIERLRPRLDADHNMPTTKSRRRWRFPKGADFARLMRARGILKQSPMQRRRIARQALSAGIDG